MNRPAFLLLSLLSCARQAVPGAPAAQLNDVVFDRYTPLSSNEEIARRTLTPLTFAHGQRALAARGEALGGQPVDLARERFAVYVPAGAPPAAGYGLLVFVSPGPEAPQPRRWRAPLDRHGLIFVAAAHSGNDASILERRLPLAVLAWENIRARYPLDPKRVYVGGLSGGSRVAEIAALAYPDVFRGALLNAGSEPIGGERGIYPPAADLFQRFRRTRLVYVTGEDDPGNLEDDQISQASMKEWCVFNLEVQVARRRGHEALDAPALNDALDALDRSRAVDESELSRCTARVERELAARLADAEAALQRGDREGARERLSAIDRRYGGLAAPASVELDTRLTAQR
ncbi:MAG TPA: PHB depolymerase family esterase [Myxococcales bacterium]|nr:PHB depolymerase family esterase [Myxococcales bacterium]